MTRAPNDMTARSAGSATDEPIIDAAFLESVQHLRIVARRVARGGRWAEQRSQKKGSGLEFRDYRPYTPGDELRTIDWNIYRRLGRVFVRLFEELEDLPIYLMPDLSGSMWFESPPRARAALRTSMALAAISLNQHDAVGLFPFGETLTMDGRPKAGRAQVFHIASRLETLGAEARRAKRKTDLAASLNRFNSLGLRQGLLVVMSDFFHPAGLDPVIAELKRTRHRLLLVQIVRPDDRSPRADGDVRVRDCEGGEIVDVSVTPAVMDRYRAAYDRFQTTLTDFCRQRQSGLLQVNAAEPVVPQLANLFESGRLTV